MSERKRVFLGGSGRLGSVFLPQNLDYLAPPHSQVDLASFSQVLSYLDLVKPELVVHAAAVVGALEAEANKHQAYLANVIGTENVVRACREVGAKLIFISSVAVFDGERGNYAEDDIPIPSYFYGWTKLLGEQLVKMLDDFVIIRTDFFDPNKIKYHQVFIDHFCSKIPVMTLVKYLERIANSEFNGILHIGQERQSLFEILAPYLPKIEGILIRDSSLPNFPTDLSLDVSLMKDLFPLD